MSLKAIVGAGLLVPVLLLASGCAVRVPNATSGGASAPVYTNSWVERIKLRIEQPSRGARVASTTPTSWHRVNLTVGRLDGAAPVRVLSLDPFESELSARTLNDVVPGADYFVRVDLVHLSRGEEWVVGSGRLGGDGQVVRFNPGPNGLPIEVRPVVAGAVLDMAPTPVQKRRSSSRASGIVVVSSSTASTLPAASEPLDEGDDDEALIDWILGGDDDWGTYGEYDDDEGGGSDESDDESEGVLGDWLDRSASAFKRAK